MEQSIPWIEKYRPTNIDEIIFDDLNKRQIEIFIQNTRDVHLIFTGPPGIGKTTTVRCIAKKTLGDNIKSGYLELNAAEDRGVKNISAIVPAFCKKIVNFDTPKLILFDEADIMTTKCQYDINEMIKTYGKNTKFVFTCNDSSKIIEDIQSVCRIVRFKYLSNEQIYGCLEKICQAEDVSYEKKGLEMICYISGGDLRKAINDLQKTAYTFDVIKKSNVLCICKVPDPDEIKKIMDICVENRLEDAIQEITSIINQGYYYLDIITGFVHVISHYDTIEKRERLELVRIVNNTKIILSSSVRSELQLSAMICRIVKRLNY